MDPLAYTALYLGAAVVAVPLAKRFGLGSVLGYLLAGLAIGPVLGLVGSETETIKHFAEFGVVMMLFLIGLELRPSMLWRMRGQLFGLGGLQVVGCSALFAAAGVALGLPWQTAMAIGLTLALSSTAIVLQTLAEKGWTKTPAGESTFAVLLFQDIAVIPILALLPLLAVLPAEASAEGHGSALEGLPAWLQGIAINAAMGAIVLAGRFLVRPSFRYIAAARLREVFTAAALLLVVGVAFVMTKIGLSPALGTFLAGVVLSDSEYRHALESDIEPFKGLFLGVFFISVGAGIDFALFTEMPGTILGLAAGVMAVKLAVVLGVGLLFGRRGKTLWLFGLALAQAGEFSFVLFGFAESAGVIAPEMARILVLSVALTMLLTPLLFILYERRIAPSGGQAPDPRSDVIDRKGKAIVAGIGRFGLVVGRMLQTNGYNVVVLDQDADLIEFLRKIGITTYYGDATRIDLLEAAGLEEAELFVAAFEDRERQVELVRHVAQHHPNCRIVARASDRVHSFELEAAGATHVERELLEGAISAGREALIAMGAHPFKAERQARSFRLHEKEMQDELRAHWAQSGLDQGYVSVARARSAQLPKVMESDRMTERHDSSERGWTPPPKDANLS